MVMGLGLGLPFTRKKRAAALPGLLDVYPGAAFAFSTRLLRDSYTGPCLRVRRSSDNAEQDIGFSTVRIGGYRWLDQVAIEAFVGSGNDGFVTTWYDQSGAALNLSQATAAKQPRAVLSGTVETRNGRPTVRFLGTGGFQSAAVTLPVEMEVGFVCQNNTTGGRFFIEHGPNTIASAGFFLFGSSNSAWRIRRTLEEQRDGGIVNWSGFDFSVYRFRSQTTIVPTAPTIRRFIGPTEIGPDNLVGTALTINTNFSGTLNVGERNNSGAALSNMWFSELVLWPSLDSARFSGYLGNANAAFGI